MHVHSANVQFHVTLHRLLQLENHMWRVCACCKLITQHHAYFKESTLLIYSLHAKNDHRDVSNRCCSFASSRLLREHILASSEWQWARCLPSRVDVLKRINSERRSILDTPPCEASQDDHNRVRALTLTCLPINIISIEWQVNRWTRKTENRWMNSIATALRTLQ